MNLTPMRLTVLGFCLLMLAATVPGLMQSPAVAGPPVMKPGDDGGGSGAPDPMIEAVLIQADQPYSSVIAAIEAAGGSVTRTYKNFDGIAATIPRSAIRTIGALTGPERIAKDIVVPAPKPRDRFSAKDTGLEKGGSERAISFESVSPISAADIASFAASTPEAYLFNNMSTNVNVLHAAGHTGLGMVVGVIDSGIRPGYPHISLDGSVIGCEDFVGDAFGCSNSGNSGHGTFVAGMISANVSFAFGLGLVNIVNTYLPSAVVPPNRIPMVGSAPRSSIYALRVFPPTGGAPTSTILAAMDRAIELRLLFDAGDPAGVDISVVNMSLGGPTLNAGRDLFDNAVEAMAAADIVVVTSSGNAGPSGMTGGSPASSYSSLAVGASSIAGYERIVRTLQFPTIPGVGALYRPTTHMQTAVFSSRGPNADGRLDPEISASGDWSYGQGFGSPAQVGWAGGTSFSSPTVAGIAAVLRQAHPGANAAQIANAIAMTGNPALYGDNSTVHDTGSGYVDAAAASALLATGTVPATRPAPLPFVKSVQNNIETNSGLTVVTGNHTSHVGPLEPGERGEIYYKVNPNTAQVVVTVFNYNPELPPNQQNVLFGDDFLVAIHRAKTSRQSGTSGYFVPGDFTFGESYVINNPEPGIIRVTVNGDWTNAGWVEGDVNIFSIADPLPGTTAQGKVAEGDLIFVPFTVPAGTALAQFRLGWREDWGNYPTNDVDLILISPNGTFNFAGATFNAPETATLVNPMAGNWNVVISGFEFHTTDDKYDLRIVLDGNVVN